MRIPRWRSTNWWARLRRGRPALHGHLGGGAGGRGAQLAARFRRARQKLKVNAGTDRQADLGPLVSVNARKRVEGLIQKGVEEGAKLLLDGRGIKVEGYGDGNFVGPTISMA